MVASDEDLPTRKRFNPIQVLPGICRLPGPRNVARHEHKIIIRHQNDPVVCIARYLEETDASPILRKSSCHGHFLAGNGIHQSEQPTLFKPKYFTP